MNPQTTVDEFFEKLPVEDKQDADIFNEKTETTPKKEESIDDPEEIPEDLKNRRHRRLEQKNQALREEIIAVNERVKVLSEMDKFAKQTEGIIPDIAKMFSNDDLGKENALRLSNTLRTIKEEAKLEALKEVEERQANTRAEQEKYEQEIDSELESLEDVYNVDLTSDAPKARKTRREFLELVQELSPKDKDGTITGYADFDSTFKVYQKTHTQESSNSRQKEIASRSMQKGTQSQSIERKPTPGFSGWKIDYQE